MVLISGVVKNRQYRVLMPQARYSVSARIDTVDGEFLDVVGHAQHAVREDAASVGRDQRRGEQAGVLAAHAAAGEDRRDDAFEHRRIDAPVAR